MAAEQRSRSGRLVWMGLLAAGVVGLGLYAAYGVEWVEQVIDLGYGDEALRNRYLAAELFLREQGVEAETVSGMGILEGLPPVGDALVITSTRRAMSERRVERLSRWVEAGGHLVVVAREHYDEETGSSQDPLLDRYGIHLVHASEMEECAEDPEACGEDEEGEEDELGYADESQEQSAEAAGEPESDAGPGADGIEQTVGNILEEALSGALPECRENEEALAFLYSRDGARPLELELSGSDHLVDAGGGSRLTAFGESGAQLVHVPVGQGRITATASLEIWMNHRIHCHDHAYVLWLLVSHRDKVWLLHDPDIPSLAALLAARLPLTFAGVTALVLLWAAAASLRFGPMTPGAGAARRELLEHLEASAHFLWRRRLMGGALDELREEIAQRAASGHRAWPALDASRRMEHLAELIDRPASEVREAFRGGAPATRRELVQTMQTLQSIRRKL